ncbi:MAG: VanZ family protein [Chloroflexi bacterium]|nr:VanZ family protein [Chloroflexota bacterium]
MTPRRLRRLADAAMVLAAAAILALTLSPPDTLLASGFNIDAGVGHFALFAALGVASALRFAVSARARRFPRSSLGAAFFGFWLFAAATELLQGPVGRDPNMTHWLLDMAGAVVGFLLGSLVLRTLIRPVQASRTRRARRTDPQ